MQNCNWKEPRKKSNVSNFESDLSITNQFIFKMAGRQADNRLVVYPGFPTDICCWLSTKGCQLEPYLSRHYAW